MTKPSRRVFTQLAAALVGSTLIVGPVRAQNQSPKNRIVIQVSDNDPAKWNLALNNLRNLQHDLGEEGLEAEVVVYGPGIGMLKADSPVAGRIADALKSGAKVVACENTMKGQKLVHADMLPDIGYVPAGVTELMKKQQQGWAYIRP